jgi:hypothetical protein
MRSVRVEGKAWACVRSVQVPIAEAHSAILWLRSQGSAHQLGWPKPCSIRLLGPPFGVCCAKLHSFVLAFPPCDVLSFYARFVWPASP